MKAEIVAEHAWLHGLVGEWSFEMAEIDGVAQPPGTMSGRETVRLLGDIWLLCEGRGQMPDGTQTTTLMTLGYDPVRGDFVGTWIGSMMNHLWVYRRGTLDAERRALQLDAEGPAFSGPPGTMAQYRDIVEIVSDDERLLHGNLQGADGQWTRFMTSRYRRVRSPV